MAIGALEPQFYAELRKLAGLSDPDYDAQLDSARSELQEKMAALVQDQDARRMGQAAGRLRRLRRRGGRPFDAPKHPHLVAATPSSQARAGCSRRRRRASRARRLRSRPPASPPVDVADILAQWAGDLRRLNDSNP